MTQKEAKSRFFQAQNIKSRKAFREIDLYYSQQISSQGRINDNCRQDSNFLVAGPRQAGKSSLLRTLFYALNGNFKIAPKCSQIGDIPTMKVQIKKKKRMFVQGMSKLTKTDDKLEITGTRIVSQSTKESPLQMYEKAGKLVSYGEVICHKQIRLTANQINSMIICLPAAQHLAEQDLLGLKYLISDLEQRKFPYVIVLTKIDLVLGHDEPEISRLVQLQNWKTFICKQLGCSSQDVFYNMQNYQLEQEEDAENSEQINYYALNLLRRIIKINKVRDQQVKLETCSRFLFCG